MTGNEEEIENEIEEDASDDSTQDPNFQVTKEHQEQEKADWHDEEDIDDSQESGESQPVPAKQPPAKKRKRNTQK